MQKRNSCSAFHFLQHKETGEIMIETSEFSYRQMTERDVGDFYSVRFSVSENKIHPHQVHLLNSNLLREKIRQGGGSVCEYRGQVVGVCLPVITDKPFISALFVKPDFDGNGVGHTLLDRALAWLTAKGVKQVSLVTDPGSRADKIYQHLGWQRGELDEFGCQVTFTLFLDR
jgi:GNAT superfamily N-acetyltransferase